jgi:hypothetical protein
MRSLTALSIAIASSSAAAQATLSGHIGADTMRSECAEVADPLGRTEISSCRSDRLSSALRVGYTWSNGLGLETTLYQLNHATAARFSPFANDVYGLMYVRNSYVHSRDTYRSKAGTLAITVAARPYVGGELKGKFGWAETSTRISSCDVINFQKHIELCHLASSARRQAAYVGAAMSHAFVRDLALTLSIDSLPLGRLDTDLYSTIKPSTRERTLLATLGLQWSF